MVLASSTAACVETRGAFTDVAPAEASARATLIAVVGMTLCMHAMQVIGFQSYSRCPLLSLLGHILPRYKYTYKNVECSTTKTSLLGQYTLLAMCEVPASLGLVKRDQYPCPKYLNICQKKPIGQENV